ncbi:hypothetical protein T439DRAFT_321297 [Meredithblackwellia eburnea MCA 4105]
MNPTLLRITPTPISSLPTSIPDLTSSLSTAASSLFSTFPSSPWRKGKSFQNNLIQTYSQPGSQEQTEGFKWHARESVHKVDGGWEAFRRGLLENHSLNEKKYIESCIGARNVQVLSPGVAEVWEMSYKTPFPTSNRSFLILILTLDLTAESSTSPRKFQVISIPITHSDAPEDGQKGFVRGNYVAVEEVDELEDGSVRWRMATASNAGGSIPRFLSEPAM